MMSPSLVVVIGLVAACSASPSLYFSGPQYYSGYYAAPAAVVSPIKSQYHTQNEFGHYAYGYNDGYSSKSETKHANGLTEGAYSYVDPNGVLQQYKYVSDENGYRVSGTNLPVAPAVPVVEVPAVPAVSVEDSIVAVKSVPAHFETPAAVAVAAPVYQSEIPQQVQDTPEVAAAKVAHQIAYDEAKKAADASPAEEEPSSDAVVQDSAAAPAAAAPAAPVFQAELPQPVQDTPEVTAAKLAHQIAFDEAKKAESAASAADLASKFAPAPVLAAAPAAVTSYSYHPTAYAAYPSYAAVPAHAPVASYAYGPVASYAYAAAPAPSYAYAASPFAASSYSPVHSQYHSQDEFGQYSYGYNSGSSSKAEVKTVDGVTRGGYSYVDANGQVQHYNYVSDPVNGFRVAGTNLPAANAL